MSNPTYSDSVRLRYSLVGSARMRAVLLNIQLAEEDQPLNLSLTRAAMRKKLTRACIGARGCKRSLPSTIFHI